MKNLKIINMTPHDVTLIDRETKAIKITFPPSGETIRLKSETNVLEYPFSKTTFYADSVTPLPKKIDGHFYIVSQLVKSAFSDRSDFVVPAEIQRDEKNLIIGCFSLGL